MAEETRLRLTHGRQLQEGLRDKILEGPTVVGSLDYTALCLVAKNEERRLTELASCLHYPPGPVMPFWVEERACYLPTDNA